jgi:RNA polymerase sigma factor (sigma-70 family)
MSRQAAAVLGQAIGNVADAGRASLSDRELLQRFAINGDQEAFAALFRRHSGMVLGVCRRALPQMQDAEDACQATFLLLSRNAASSRWHASVANWLYLTARRAASNIRRASERQARRERKAALPEAQQPLDSITGRELLEILDLELDNLPSVYREPLVLCYLEGLTRDEAALRLRVPSGTVKTRLERGRKRLADALARRGCVAGAGLLALAATSDLRAASAHLSDTIRSAAAGQALPGIVRIADGIVGKSLFNRSVAALLLLAGAAAAGFGLISGQPAVGKGEAMAAPREDNKPVAKASAEKPTEGPVPRSVSGRVVDPDGKPVAGAKLFAPVITTDTPLSPDALELRAIGTADGEGRFSVSVPPPFKDAPWSYAIAYAPGFGVSWVELDRNKPGAPLRDQTMRLAKDLPISGRIVNTEGKPMAAVSITVAGIRISGTTTSTITWQLGHVRQLQAIVLRLRNTCRGCEARLPGQSPLIATAGSLSEVPAPNGW